MEKPEWRQPGCRMRWIPAGLSKSSVSGDRTFSKKHIFMLHKTVLHIQIQLRASMKDKCCTWVPHVTVYIRMFWYSGLTPFFKSLISCIWITVLFIKSVFSPLDAAKSATFVCRHSCSTCGIFFYVTALGFSMMATVMTVNLLGNDLSSCLHSFCTASPCPSGRGAAGNTSPASSSEWNTLTVKSQYLFALCSHMLPYLRLNN